MPRKAMTPAQRSQRHDVLAKRLDVLSEAVFETHAEIRHLEREMIERNEMEDTKGGTGALDFMAHARGATKA